MKLLRILLASLAFSLVGLASLQAAGPSIEMRVDRLDALVHLTPKQKVEIAAVFREEDEALAQIKPSDMPALSSPARQASRAGVRALLTPEQRKVYDLSPQTLGGGLVANPEFLAARLDQAVHLTGAQQKQAIDIFWNNLREQIAAMPDDQPLKGFNFSNKVRDELRAILTPEQQAKFDVTPPYRRGPGNR